MVIAQISKKLMRMFMAVLDNILSSFHDIGIHRELTVNCFFKERITLEKGNYQDSVKIADIPGIALNFALQVVKLNIADHRQN